MALQFFDAAGGAIAPNSIFIPVADLPGLTAAELAAVVPVETKTARFLFSFGKKLYSALSPASVPKLGFSIGRGEASNGLDISSRSFTYSVSYAINILSGNISVLPVPSIGANANLGGFTYSFVFPGATLGSANSPSAGVAIPVADLSSVWRFSVEGEGIEDMDAREFIAAMFAWVFANVVSRAALIASAVTAKGRNNPTNATLPAGAVDATNPTTGLDASQINNIALLSYGWSYTVQTKDNQATETFDVNVVAA